MTILLPPSRFSGSIVEDGDDDDDVEPTSKLWWRWFIAELLVKGKLDYKFLLLDGCCANY